MINIKSFLLLSSILCFNTCLASDEISELEGVSLNTDNQLEKEIIYLTNGSTLKEDKLCTTPKDEVYGSCYGEDTFKGIEFQKGVIKSFDTINVRFYKYINIEFEDGRNAYLIIPKDNDIQSIYGDESPIMKYSQYKTTLNFQPEPLVKDSKITLVEKQLPDKYESGERKYEKNLTYIDSNSIKYKESDVDKYREIYSNYIKNVDVIDMLPNFSVDLDKMDKKLFIYSKKSLDAPIAPRVVIIKNEKSLVLDINYIADDWLFVKNITISVDGELFDINDLNFNREVGSGTVYETSLKTLDNQQIELIKKIIKSKNSFVRFNGKSYYKDKEITIEQKKEMLEILKIYYLAKK
jgi:hypothetical protein